MERKKVLEKGMFIENYAKRVNLFLKDFFEEQKLKISPAQTGMFEHLEEFCLRGGKRLRPALVYLGFRLLGGKDSEDIVKVSLVTEFIHSFFLIHDDVMDESTTRRGKPTVHCEYEARCRERYRSFDKYSRLGESLAILAGDLSYCLATRLLCQIKLPPERKIQVLDKLHEMVIATIFGQELDLRIQADTKVAPRDVIQMYRMKTAKYSFEGPLQIGVILAGGNQKDLEIISSYAIPLGIAFQIQDDILGLFGTEEVTGKSVRNDIEQGKQTLLIAKALENGSKKERKTIQEALGNNRVSKTQIKELQDIVKSTGALSYANQLAERHMKKAKVVLQKMHQKDYERNILNILEDITDFVIRRNA